MQRAVKAPRVVVIGAGISGLSHAYFLKKKFPHIDLRILEASSHIGGCINSGYQAGLLLEQGARGIVPRRSGQSVLRLAEDLGIADEIVFAEHRNKRRYLYIENQLRQVPNSLFGLVFDPILRQRLKAITKDLKVKPGERPDESVADFTRRHFGEEVLQKLVQPFISGTRGGAVETLSARKSLPILSSLEREYGSVLKGLFLERKQFYLDSAFSKQQFKAGYFSFKKGLGTLPKAINQKLGSIVDYNQDVRRLELVNGVYRVITTEETYAADFVICTIPAYALAAVVRELSTKLAANLMQIDYAPIATVSLGYDQVPHKFRGFGYLSAQDSEHGILGCSWNNQVFPAQYTKNQYCLTVNIGGNNFNNFDSYSSDDFISIAQDNLRKHLGISIEPMVKNCLVRKFALPQPAVGHQEVIDAIKQQCPQGLNITGNYIEGLGVSQLVQSAKEWVSSLDSEALLSDSNNHCSLAI